MMSPEWWMEALRMAPRLAAAGSICSDNQLVHGQFAGSRSGLRWRDFSPNASALRVFVGSNLRNVKAYHVGHGWISIRLTSRFFRRPR